jgi:hypothetical protein
MTFPLGTLVASPPSSLTRRHLALAALVAWSIFVAWPVLEVSQRHRQRQSLASCDDLNTIRSE